MTELQTKINTAIERLKAFEPADEPYYLCYSGGKDSDCIRILADLAGVKHDIVHNLTTVDAPETVRYIKSVPNVQIITPQYSMWQLIEKKKIPPTRLVRYCCDELIIDNFAGGGGASCGIELATGRPVDIAINHDPDAIAMHRANHPYTRHYQESVWNINPKEICQGHKVGLAWFSPDCKHFSKAKGGKPVDKNIRGLAWIVLKWAGIVKPRVII